MVVSHLSYTVLASFIPFPNATVSNEGLGGFIQVQTRLRPTDCTVAPEKSKATTKHLLTSGPEADPVLFT